MVYSRPGRILPKKKGINHLSNLVNSFYTVIVLDTVVMSIAVKPYRHYVVPENIHIPSTEGFLVLTPPPPPNPAGNSNFVAYYLWLLTLLRVGMDIFWNCTFP